MRVLLVSTSERSGGGAIAARRLLDALVGSGVEARMLVRDKQSDADNVVRVGTKLPKFLERLAVLPRISPFKDGLKGCLSRLWQADIANVGISITGTKAFREADVVHLHWVQQGMISLDELGKILRSGKRIVWTLHDEWPYLGVCHYRASCTEQECRRCPLLSGSLPYYIYRRKHELFRRHRPTFVGCSRWITEEARRAMPSVRVEHINNCIPSALFHPSDRQEARRALALPADGRLLLFCSQKVSDERKGIAYLSEALKRLKPDGTGQPVGLLIVGKDSEQIPLPEDVRSYRFGSVGEQTMPLLYNAADAFLTPSLQDNLPNTIAEAMSCGTPCVGFNVGGIPEMIDHEANGYVARYRDAADLAEGIRFVLSHDLRDAAHRKAAEAYDEASVARQYLGVYSD